MSNKARVLNHLQALSIPCEVYEHPAVFTMEECLALPCAAPDVTFCKNILLCNRQQTAFYLYVTLPDKPFRTADTSKLLHSSRLSFACLLYTSDAADDAGAGIRELVAAGSVV